MKKCKKCQSEIDIKATKCPNCQSDLRSWPKKHPIITVLLVLLIIGIVTSGGSKGKKNGSNTQLPQTKNEETAKPTEVEVIKISALELGDDFDANQVSAEKKWQGKKVEFSAKISNITDSGLSFQNITSKDFSITQISCRIKNKEQLLPLKNGQTTTVRGIVGTQTMGVIGVNDCEVIE